MYNLGEQFKVGKNSVANSKSIIKGDKYRITVLTERLLRLEYSEKGIFEDRATEHVFNRKLDIPKFEVMEDARMITIVTDYLKLYSRENDSPVILYHLDQKFHDYILVLLRQLKHEFALELSRRSHTYLGTHDGLYSLTVSELNGTVLNTGGVTPDFFKICSFSDKTFAPKALYSSR